MDPKLLAKIEDALTALNKWVRTLNDHADNTSSRSSYLQAEDAVGALSYIFDYEDTKLYVDKIVNILCHSENGLPQVVNRSRLIKYPNDTIDEIRKSILKDILIKHVLKYSSELSLEDTRTSLSAFNAIFLLDKKIQIRIHALEATELLIVRVNKARILLLTIQLFSHIHDLINELLKFLQQATLKSSASSTLTLTVSRILGAALVAYPEAIAQSKLENLQKSMIFVIRDQWRNAQQIKSIEFSKLESAFWVLTAVLKILPRQLADACLADDLIDPIINMLKTASVTYATVKTFMFLIQHNSSSFASVVINAPQLGRDLLDIMISACEHKTKTVRSEGFRALDAFATSISNGLMQLQSQECEHHPIFTKLYQIVASKIAENSIDQQKSYNNLAIAVAILGDFAKPLAKIYGSSKIRVIILTLVNKYSLNQNITENSLNTDWAKFSMTKEDHNETLPRLLSALSKMIKAMDSRLEFGDDILLCIERMLSTLLNKLSHLDPKRRFSARVALKDLLLAFWGRTDKSMDQILNLLITSLLALSIQKNITYSVLSAKKSDTERALAEKERILEVWRDLLFLYKDDISNYALDKELCVLILDRFFETALRILTSLKIDKAFADNILDDAESFDFEQETNFKLHRNKNLVLKEMLRADSVIEILDLIISGSSWGLLSKWISVLSEELIILCQDSLPLPSLYNLLAKVFSLSHESDVVQNESMIMIEFLKNTILQIPQSEHKLLESRLYMILCTPPSFINNFSHEFFGVWKLAMELTVSDLRIVDAAIRALETLAHQNQAIVNDNINLIYSSIIQLVQPLNNKVDVDNLSYSIPSSARINRDQSPRMKSKNLYLSVCKRALRLLGEMGGILKERMNRYYSSENICWNFPHITEEELGVASLTSSTFLDVEMLCDETFGSRSSFPRFSLTRFLPLLAEKALLCPVYKERLIACELLHAIVLHGIGMTSTLNMSLRRDGPDAKTGNSWSVVLQKILPYLLKLAVDSDDNVRDIFDSLVQQLVHYACFLPKSASGVSVVLNGIANTVVDFENSKYSQFQIYGAKQISTFLIWSLNLTGQDEIKNNPLNGVSIILKRINSLARHPDSSSRIIASQIMTQEVLYHLKNNETAIDVYIFETLYAFLTSLKLSNDQQTEQNTIDVIQMTVDIIKNHHRVLSEDCQENPRLGFSNVRECCEYLLSEALTSTSRSLRTESMKALRVLTSSSSTNMTQTKELSQWLLKREGTAKILLSDCFNETSNWSNDQECSMAKCEKIFHKFSWMFSLSAALSEYQQSIFQTHSHCATKAVEEMLQHILFNSQSGKGATRISKDVTGLIWPIKSFMHFVVVLFKKGHILEDTPVGMWLLEHLGTLSEIFSILLIFCPLFGHVSTTQRKPVMYKIREVFFWLKRLKGDNSLCRKMFSQIQYFVGERLCSDPTVFPNSLEKIRTNRNIFETLNKRSSIYEATLEGLRILNESCLLVNAEDLRLKLLACVTRTIPDLSKPDEKLSTTANHVFIPPESRHLASKFLLVAFELGLSFSEWYELVLNMQIDIMTFVAVYKMTLAECFQNQLSFLIFESICFITRQTQFDGLSKTFANLVLEAGLLRCMRKKSIGFKDEKIEELMSMVETWCNNSPGNEWIARQCFRLSLAHLLVLLSPDYALLNGTSSGCFKALVEYGLSSFTCPFQESSTEKSSSLRELRSMGINSLPLILQHGDKNILDSCRNMISRIVAQELPSFLILNERSDNALTFEFVRETLAVFSESPYGAYIILPSFIRVFVQLSESSVIEDLESCLQSLLRISENEIHEELFQDSFNLLQNVNNRKEIRAFSTKKICASLLKIMNSDVAIKMIKRNLEYFLLCIRGPFENLSSTIEETLFRASCAWTMLLSFFDAMSKEVLLKEISDDLRNVDKTIGNFAKYMITMAYKTAKGDARHMTNENFESDEEKSLQSELRRVAYNFEAVAVLKIFGDQPKYLESLLREDCLGMLVDKTITFRIDFESNIRFGDEVDSSESKQTNEPGDGSHEVSIVSLLNALGSMSTMNTQMLLHSTLEGAVDDSNKSKQHERSKNASDGKEIYANQSMAFLVNMMKNFHENSSFLDQERKDSWRTKFDEVVANFASMLQHSPPDLKILIAELCLYSDSYFFPEQRQKIFAPLCDVAVRSLKLDRGIGINSFVRKICVRLLNWEFSNQKNNRRLFSADSNCLNELLYFLVRNVATFGEKNIQWKSILDFNLKLVEKVLNIMRTKNDVVFPSEHIRYLISKSSQREERKLVFEDGACIAGLKLIQIALENKIDCRNLFEVMQIVTKLLSVDQNVIYETAATTIGKYLEYCPKDSFEHKEIVGLMNNHLDDLKSIPRKEQAFLKILESLCLVKAESCCYFIEYLLKEFESLKHGPFRIQILKLLQMVLRDDRQYSKTVIRKFEIYSQEILTNHENEALQIQLCRLASILINTENNVEYFVSSKFFKSFLQYGPSVPNSIVRKELYKFLINVIDKQDVLEKKKELEMYLLAGLDGSDVNSTEIILAHFDKRMPQHIGKRFLSLFEIFLSGKHLISNWIGVMATLVLKVSEKSVFYREPLHSTLTGIQSVITPASNVEYISHKIDIREFNTLGTSQGMTRLSTMASLSQTAGLFSSLPTENIFVEPGIIVNKTSVHHNEESNHIKMKLMEIQQKFSAEDQDISESTYHIRKAIKRREEKEVKVMSFNKRKDVGSHTGLSRNYKKDNFPDIAICPKDFYICFLKLAMCSEEFAKRILVTYFRGYWTSDVTNDEQDVKSELIHYIKRSMVKLKDQQHCVSFFLEILFVLPAVFDLGEIERLTFFCEEYDQTISYLDGISTKLGDSTRHHVKRRKLDDSMSEHYQFGIDSENPFDILYHLYSLKGMQDWLFDRQEKEKQDQKLMSEELGESLRKENDTLIQTKIITSRLAAAHRLVSWYPDDPKRKENLDSTCDTAINLSVKSGLVLAPNALNLCLFRILEATTSWIINNLDKESIIFYDIVKFQEFVEKNIEPQKQTYGHICRLILSFLQSDVKETDLTLFINRAYFRSNVLGPDNKLPLNTHNIQSILESEELVQILTGKADAAIVIEKWEKRRPSILFDSPKTWKAFYSIRLILANAVGRLRLTSEKKNGTEPMNSTLLSSSSATIAKRGDLLNQVLCTMSLSAEVLARKTLNQQANSLIRKTMNLFKNLSFERPEAVTQNLTEIIYRDYAAHRNTVSYAKMINRLNLDKLQTQTDTLRTIDLDLALRVLKLGYMLKREQPADKHLEDFDFMDQIRCVLDWIFSNDESISASAQEKTKIFVTFSEFAFREISEGSLNADETQKLHFVTARAVFECLHLGSVKGVAMLPELLCLLSIMKSTKNFEHLEHDASSCVVGLYLPWHHHVITLFLRSTGALHKLLFGILKRLVEAYPQEVYYCWRRMTKDQDETGFVSDIESCFLTVSPLLEKFIEEVENLLEPKLVLESILREVKSNMREQNRAATSTNIHTLNLTIKRMTHPDTKATFRMKFANILMNGIQKFLLLETERSKKVTLNENFDLTKILKPDDEEQFRSFCDVIEKHVNMSHSASSELKMTSPWLASFDNLNIGIINYPCMEIAVDEFLNNRIIRTTPHIVSFHEEMTSMPSKQSPKKITILGDDLKYYSILVKGHEDLRNDQIIQSVIASCNDVLGRNAYKSEPNYRLFTYGIVPIHSKLGLVQWIEGMKSIGRVLEDQLSFKLHYSDSAKIHYLMNTNASFSSNDLSSVRIPKAADYRRTMCELSDESAFQGYKQSVELSDINLLKRALSRISNDWNSFMRLKMHFFRSIVALCVVTYIFGIGDRHLDNLLLKPYDRMIVGIDFGESFGRGVTNLPVPELIPFRFGPQFEALLHPLDTRKIFVRELANSLRILQERKSAILSNIKLLVESSTFEANENYRAFVLEIIKMKLTGSDPRNILLRQLTSDFSVTATYGREYQRNLSRIINNVGNDMFPNTKNPNNGEISVELQAQLLLDLATDPVILAHSYHGLCLWL